MQVSPSFFDFTKDQIYEVIRPLRTKLDANGLKNANLTLHKGLSYNKETKSLRKYSHIDITGTYSAKFADTIACTLEEIQKTLKESYGVEADIDRVMPGRGEGESFPCQSLISVSDNQTAQFACNPGEVTLVYAWTHALRIYSIDLDQSAFFKMIEKNAEKWNGNVRSVAILMRECQDPLQEVITKNKWDKAEHYIASLADPTSGLNEVHVGWFPFVFLMDKKGIIRYLGDSEGVNLEGMVDQLISEQDEAVACTSVGTSEFGSTQPSLSFDEESEVFKHLLEKHETYKYLLENVGRDGISVEGRSIREFTPYREKVLEECIYMAGDINSQEKAAVFEYWKNVIQPISKSVRPHFLMSLYDAPEVRYGGACANCKKNLSEGTPHYVCTVCQSQGKQDTAFCLDCADKELTQEISCGKDLFHEHALLLLNNDYENSLMTLRRSVKNTEIIHEGHPDFEKLKADQGEILCRACFTYVVPPNYRWRCANCRIDLCDNCFKASKDPNNEKHKEVAEALQENGHKNSHAVFRQHYLMKVDFDSPKDLKPPESD